MSCFAFAEPFQCLRLRSQAVLRSLAPAWPFWLARAWRSNQLRNRCWLLRPQRVSTADQACFTVNHPPAGAWYRYLVHLEKSNLNWNVSRGTTRKLQSCCARQKSQIFAVSNAQKLSIFRDLSEITMKKATFIPNKVKPAHWMSEVISRWMPIQW